MSEDVYSLPYAITSDLIWDLMLDPILLYFFEKTGSMVSPK